MEEAKQEVVRSILQFISFDCVRKEGPVVTSFQARLEAELSQNIDLIHAEN